MHDLIITGATVVDPLTGFMGEADVAVEAGVITEVAPGLSAEPARKALDASGLILQPGIIDTHLHLAPSPLGQRMAVKAGVTTAIEMAGPVEKVLDDMASAGCGLSVAVLNAILPGRSVPDANPSKADVDRFIDASLAAGAFGVKLLGGHYPLTPEASGRLVGRAAERGVYMASRRPWRSPTGAPSTSRTSTPTAAAACSRPRSSAPAPRSSSRRTRRSSPRATYRRETAAPSPLTATRRARRSCA